MSGGLFVDMLRRETGAEITPEVLERLRLDHEAAYTRLLQWVGPLPGARELLNHLTRLAIPWAIATSGVMSTAHMGIRILGFDPLAIPVVTRDQVRRAKPDPDLFLAAAARLQTDIESAVIVGDSIWDMLASRRARGLGVGVLSGGYGQDELERAGAIRVYEDPRDLLAHIDEIGGRP
jgi:HAD superfamily hydrolase (TIGR01549 family)